MTDDTSQPQYVAERVRGALAADPGVNELGVRVMIVEKKIFLTGNVATPERQARIGEIVLEMLPDYDVHNEVAVEELATAPKAETVS
jgi:hypothetical protein